jgi:hypothetical protein
MLVGASRAAVCGGIGLWLWLLGGCIGLEVQSGGSGSAGSGGQTTGVGQGGAGSQGGGGSGSQGAGGACSVELCDTPEIEGCGDAACAPPAWSRRLGDESSQNVRAAVVDGSGRIFLAGAYMGALDFGGGSLLPASPGTFDAYVAELAPDGTGAWASTVTVGDGPREANALAMDPAGNLIVAGSFGIPPENGDDWNVFVQKWSLADGAPQPMWTHTFGGTGIDRVVDVAVDPIGDVFVLGSLNGDAATGLSCGGVPITFTGAADDMFLAKYDIAGACAWFKVFSGAGSIEPGGITTNAFGDLRVVGTFKGLMSGGGFPPVDAGLYADLFVMKLDSIGVIEWIRQVGDEGSGKGTASGRDVALDTNGQAFVVGSAKGEVSAGGGAFSALESAALVLALDSSGNSLWVTKYGGASVVPEMQFGTGVALVGDSLYVSGTFSELVDIDPAKSGAEIVLGGNNPFLALLDAETGVTRSFDVFPGGGETFANQAFFVAASGAGLVAAASWGKELDFGGGISAPQGGGDIVLARFPVK